MRILSNLSKLGAIVALSASVVAFPAVAQHHGGGFKSHKASKFKGHHRGNFRGNRGFRGNSGFRGNRGFRNSRGFHGNRGFRNSRGFHGNRGFRSNRGFHGNRGFRSNRGFHGNRGFRSNRGFHNNRGFRGNGFNSGFKKNVVHAPVHSVGGFYGVHSNSIFISDFAAHGLYAPPRGYRWVCDKGSKDAILAAVATGAIIAIAADVLATPY